MRPSAVITMIGNTPVFRKYQSKEGDDNFQLNPTASILSIISITFAPLWKSTFETMINEVKSEIIAIGMMNIPKLPYSFLKKRDL